MDKGVKELLEKAVSSTGLKASLKFDEPLSKHTGFKTGGGADAFVETSSPDVIRNVTQLAAEHDVPVYVIGNGSNLLAADSGFRGIIIKMSAGPAEEAVRFESDTVVIVGAGCLLSTLARECAKRGLTGLEFAAGIPGSVGGAVVMNAGAYGGEIKDVLTFVSVLTPEGEVKKIAADELNLSYRYSVVPEREWIVLEASFELKKGSPEQIFEYMDELAKKRRDKQPLEYPSAGSTFKRPEGFFAGKLIEDAGLKGFSTGGAMVSQKHAGFVINTGNATSHDIMELIDTIKSRVREKFGVELEPEVKFLGF